MMPDKMMPAREWDDSLLGEVEIDYFRLWRTKGFGSRDSIQCKTLPEALEAAEKSLADGYRVMFHLVTTPSFGSQAYAIPLANWTDWNVKYKELQKSKPRKH